MKVKQRFNGRKMLPTKSRFTAVKLSPEQHRAIEIRAERCKVTVSVWMRSILSQAASRPPKKDGYLHIREPDGTTT